MSASPDRLPDLNALALFLAVDETGSVGAAARRLGISQPAASQRLRALERELETVLVERRTTGSSLTPAGRVVAEWSAPLVRSAADFARSVSTLVDTREKRLRVASSLTVADYLMPGWLVALHEALPEVSVSLQPANSEQVIELVLANAAELGFVEGPSAPRGVRSCVIGEDELVLVVAPRHPWARLDAVTPGQLTAGSLVLREPASGTRQVLDHALASHGLHARPALQLGSTTAIKEAVVGGNDASVLSRRTVDDDLRAGALVAVPTPHLDLGRVFRAIWRGARAPSGPAGALLALAVRGLHDA